MNSTTTNTIDEKWINNATTLAKEIADLSKEAYKFIQDKQDRDTARLKELNDLLDQYETVHKPAI